MPTTRNRRNSRANSNHMTELREHVATVGEEVRQIAATAGTVAREQLDPIEEYVRVKPVQSLLMAAGVGALFAFIFLRR